VRTHHIIKLAAVFLIAVVNFFCTPDLTAGTDLFALRAPLYEPKIPKEISIDVAPAHYVKFLRNNNELLVSKHTTIGEHNKRKFAATFSWKDEKGQVQTATGTIRVNGDVTDHVLLAYGAPVTSLVVRLNTGNIGGMTRFKLLLHPTTRGEWEIFGNIFFEKTGFFLAPYTSITTMRLNGKNHTMLFQEQIGKELIERFGLREAPIIEGAERQWWLDKYAVFPEKDDAAFQPKHRCCYSNLDNRKLVRTPGFLGIAQNGLTLYNAALKKYNLYTHTIDMRFEDDTFRELIFSLGGIHGLTTTNRKFYYDPLYNLLIPIVYDGQASPYHKHWSKQLQTSLLNEKVLARLKTDEFYQEVLDAYIDRGGHRKENVKKLLEEYKAMVHGGAPTLDPSKSPNLANAFVKPDGYYPTPSRQSKIIKARFFEAPDVKAPFVFSATQSKDDGYSLCYLNIGLAFGKIQVGEFEFSGRNLVECKSISNDFFKKTLKGKASFDFNGRTMSIQTMGNINVVENGIEFEQKFKTKLAVLPEKALPSKAKLVVAPNQTIWIDFDGTGATRVEELNIQLMAAAESPGGAVLETGRVVLSGDLTHLRSVRVKGAQGHETSDLLASRFDDRLLTGCLTILDATLRNLKITAQSLKCEDAVNIVRSNGEDVHVAVSDAGGDALDVDYSTIVFSDISIQNAGNDCVDLSAGTYTIDKAFLNGCGDKGVSVGERSKVHIRSVDVERAEIAVASKDSSYTLIDSAILRNVKTCYAAYKKKQEFNGGSLKVSGKSGWCQNRIFADQHSVLEFTN